MRDPPPIPKVLVEYDESKRMEVFEGSRISDWNEDNARIGGNWYSFEATDEYLKQFGATEESWLLHECHDGMRKTLFKPWKIALMTLEGGAIGAVVGALIGLQRELVRATGAVTMSGDLVVESAAWYSAGGLLLVPTFCVIANYGQPLYHRSKLRDLQESFNGRLRFRLGIKKPD